ncbi:MAG: 4-hydroxy-tetrahydrodipicolinate reductase [Myxococcota bacterium]|jgi:4-hydroxy-tetrahydrodipicolinate reductase
MKVGVHGASGRLGKLIMTEGGAKTVAIPRGGPPPPGCDVIIDVSSPKGLTTLLPHLSGQPLVIGTTGDLPIEALQGYAEAAPVAIVPNFSAGVPLLLTLLRQAVGALPEGWDIEIVEAHHNQKKDAPSGTAKRLARAVEEAGGAPPPMHSLRSGDTFGEHTIWLCGPGERLELKHVATQRTVFAIGALRWAEQLSTAEPGMISP